jgi:hypothetical protein
MLSSLYLGPFVVEEPGGLSCTDLWIIVTTVGTVSADKCHPIPSYYRG